MHLLHRVVYVTIAGAWILSFSSGCAKAPDVELTAAKTAIKAAQDVEADKYMSNNFKNAQRALAAAEEEIAIQNSAFVMSRKYSKAKGLLNNATELATQIIAEAPGAKNEMREQVKANLSAIQEMAKETRDDIKKARRSKEKKVIEQMNADLTAANSDIAQATADLEVDNILDAAQKLGNAQMLMKKISNKLSTSGADGLM